VDRGVKVHVVGGLKSMRLGRVCTRAAQKSRDRPVVNDLFRSVLSLECSFQVVLLCLSFLCLVPTILALPSKHYALPLSSIY
jgi:hypothetical protein